MAGDRAARHLPSPMPARAVLGRRASVRLMLTVVLLALWALAGCAGTRRQDPQAARPSRRTSADDEQLPEQMLLAYTDKPVFFTGPEPDAGVVGFGSPDLLLTITGPAIQGRLPVRVEGPLEVSAFVPEELLILRVQRRGQVRGTPAYVAPDHALRVLGTAEDSARWRVLVIPVLLGEALDPMVGSYPKRGLAPQLAPAAAEPPAEGEAALVPAGIPLRLYDQPDGQLVYRVKARSEPWPLRVLGVRGGMTAIRAGEGPFLVGYTEAPLLPAEGVTPNVRDPRPRKPAVRKQAIPARLLRETGPLKRVVRGAELRFDGQVIGRFREPGYARVLAKYPNGELDVFAAIDDSVALRGLLRANEVTALESRRK